MRQEIKIQISTSYGGGVKADVYIGAKRYILDIDYLEEYLKNKIEKYGYTTSISRRQKFPRISFNVEM